MKNLIVMIIIGILIMCIPKTSNGQKWYSITGNDVAVIACQAAAGAADAQHEMIVNHKLGKGNSFWDATISWKNKYKNWDAGNTRAAYPGAKTWLVGFTDGYHLTRTLDRSFTLASIGLAAGELNTYQPKDRWKVVAKKVLLSAIANRITFNLMYK
jgi:hypothetical protein